MNFKGKIKSKRCTEWSKKEVDLNNPWQRKWYILQVLTHRLSSDISELDFDEIKRLLPELIYQEI